MGRDDQNHGHIAGKYALQGQCILRQLVMRYRRQHHNALGQSWTLVSASRATPELESRLSVERVSRRLFDFLNEFLKTSESAMTRDINVIWVGERDSNSSWIYDPRIVHHAPATVYLFHIQGKKFTEHPKRTVKKLLSTVTGEARDLLISRYLAWFEKHSESFIASLPPLPENHAQIVKDWELEDLDHRRREAIDAHKRYLRRYGKDDKGTTQRVRRYSNRRAHCYACKEKLDSSLNIACNACNWMICYCGACRCGYMKFD